MDSDDEVLVPESVTPTPTPSITWSCCSPTPSLHLPRHLTHGNTALPYSARDVSVVRSSMPELRTIKVKCRQGRDDLPPPLSVITTDMSATDLMTLILDRLKVRGLEPSTYCVIARIIAKGQDVGVETIVLEESSHPFMADKEQLKRSRFSIRQKGGILIDVYDGRKWPVVRVGSVYVTASDSTHRVTQSVLCTPNVQEKKRKASKYTVAVGTSHGHVQAFVKDSEVLLPVFQTCLAEEKCLILIKKPKDASKKMLKAQSLQNLSVSDTHLYRHPLDGTLASNHGHALTAHLMKGGKPSTSKMVAGPMVSETYSSEPRVRRGHQHLTGKGANSSSSTTSSSCSPATAMKGNNSNFVPIPELGIFTPDQHVLQNGTYAQHCHQRDIIATNSNGGNGGNNNNNKHSNSRYSKSSSYKSHTTTSSMEESHAVSKNRYRSETKHFSPRHNNIKTFSEASSVSHSTNPTGNAVGGGNSSFEESVKSDGFYNYNGSSTNNGNNTGMSKRLDFHPVRFQQQQQMLQENGVYHSCMDISTLHNINTNNNDDSNFNTLSSTNSDFYSVRSSITGGGYDTMRSENSDIIVNRGNLRENNNNNNNNSNKYDKNVITNEEVYNDHGFRSAREFPTQTKVKPQRPISPPVNKMDPSSRSHSLGDLTSGLTISLVGQKKTDSLMNVAEEDRHGGGGAGAGNCGKDTFNTGSVSTRTTAASGAWDAYGKEPRSKYGGATSPRKSAGSKMEGSRQDNGDEVDGDFNHTKQNQPFSYTKPAGNGTSSNGGGGSALQHIRDRLQKAVLNSQKIFQGSNNSNGSSSWKGRNSENKSSYSELRKSSSVDNGLSSTNKSSNFQKENRPESYFTNPKQSEPQPSHHHFNHHNHHHQQQQQHYFQKHPNHQQQSPIQRQNSAPGAATSADVDMTSQRLTTNFHHPNYQNTLSDPSLYDSNPTPPSTSSYNHHYHQPSHQPYKNLPHSSQPPPPPPLPQTSSSSYEKSSFPSQNPPSSSTSSTNYYTTSSSSPPPPLPPSGDQSPSKSKRSLPEVPLTETSERIKRFTEIMKSRVSTHSSASTSRNGGYSADGSTGSQNTPTRMSSVETTGSDQASRKSSVELTRNGDFETILETLAAPSLESTPALSSRLPEFQKDHRHDNKRDQQPFYKRGNESDLKHRPCDIDKRLAVSIQGHSQGQGNVLHSDDIVLTSGDHSSDSAHTSGTSTSYNGSTLDSGYTTNNDTENDSFQNNNNYHHHHQHKPQQQQHQQQLPHHQQFTQPPNFHKSQQQQYHQNPVPQEKFSTNNSIPPGKKRAPPPPPPPPKHSSNLANAHRFGSVQNISTAQVHGSPNDKVWLDQQSHPPNPHPNSQSMYGTLRKVEGTSYFNHQSYSSNQQGGSLGDSLSSTNRNSGNNNNNNTPYQSENQIRSTNERFDRDHFNRFSFDNKPSTRRSWDYADRNGFREVENGLQNTHKHDHRYKSSDVLYSSTSHHTQHNPAASTSRHAPPPLGGQGSYPVSFNTCTTTTNNSNSNSNSNINNSERELGFRVSTKDESLQHPYHKQHVMQPISQHNTNPPLHHQQQQHHQQQHQQQQQQQQHPPYNSSSNDWHKPNKTHPQPNQPISDHQTVKQHNQGQGQGHAHSSSSSSSSSTNWKDDSGGGGVKQRPVPVSRSNRNARGRTLPGGFRFNESENPNPNFGQSVQFNFELSLYHLTQRYDLSPLCLDLPKNLTLKDMMTFKEHTVEISLNETLGIPSSPQGKTSHIGSPGSAFTPVKHEGQVQGQPVVLKVKVITFCEIWEEVQKHSMLGRILEGDILVEVNGWFCLGADVPYLRRIVENCQGAITLTVARKKEKDEVRYKGQTPAERIKGLEMQISRLDNLIQARDEKIEGLQSAGSNPGTGKQVLTMVNGQTPREGMRIGDDEYVV